MPARIPLLLVDACLLLGYCNHVERLNQSVLITGMKHSGKSSTGRITAEMLSCVFTDTDDLAEEIFLTDTGERLSSREIFRRGRKLFQACELRAADRLSSTVTPLVAAAGGGLCDNEAAVSRLKKTFLFIYIEEDAGILFNRIMRGGIPAFLSQEKPWDDFLQLYKTRSEKYDRICNIKITAAGRTAEEISRELLQKLMEGGYAG